MTEYLKPALSFDAQLLQLEERGLAVPDRGLALLYLQRVGYYRLMGYLYPQRLQQSDHYIEGANIDEALALYEFDRCLRELVIEAVGHIEVAVRTSITHNFSSVYGPFGHHVAANFSFSPEWHREWIAKVRVEVERSREAFLLHYRNKYTDPPFPMVPIWMASEVMSIGTLSKFYSAMHPAHQKVIARDFELRSPVLKNWLHFASVLRNVAAHHGRLWNRELGVKPFRPHGASWSEERTPYSTSRCFYTLLVLRYLLRYTTALDLDWRDRVTKLLERYLNVEHRVVAIGADPGWKSHPLWG